MSKECKRVDEFEIIFQDVEGLNAYIGPSPLESALTKIYNDMWKSKNGLLNQKLCSSEIQRLKPQGKKEYQKSDIGGLATWHISASNIRASVYRGSNSLEYQRSQSEDPIVRHIGNRKSELQAHRCIACLRCNIGTSQHQEDWHIGDRRIEKLE